MQNQAKKKIILEHGGRSYKAYFENDPGSCGVGRTRKEAIAALYTYEIGKLILDNPEQFGFEIVDNT
ncbi:MAG: hypothetical protein A2831_02840 [Candidatus Yanofskybacteria bacterium RIFCSPHIGHO2_01_FULL_44_17]|uniref:Uncharacterized protein n=1 Tax=Candidatus Yanofskybacteria bacterium RIFCSPHIGHO2_01_FULL_44_17 TaxID=1802668 RepID=A0A1F8EWQ3_9BACT|nr:MAG: hypothetical protein A2831_02840 [Candidatus Yanofskybacteria bacterium RIFCSPHIGHO2_01_FULL_44_17]